MRDTCDAACIVYGLPAGYDHYNVQAFFEGDAGHLTVAHPTQALRATCQLKTGFDPCGTVTVPFVGTTPLEGFWEYNIAQRCANFDCGRVEVPLCPGVGRVQARIANDQVDIAASFDRYFCNLAAGFDPVLWLKKCELRCDNTTLLSSTGDQKSFTGTIAYAVWHSIAQKYGMPLQGDGDITYVGTILPTGLQIKLAMKDGNVRIAQTYGVIKKSAVTVTLDIPTRTVTIDDGSIDLYKGTLNCSQAKFLFDTGGALCYGHMPFLVRSCLLGWKKDLFAQVSGSCMLTIFALLHFFVDYILMKI